MEIAGAVNTTLFSAPVDRTTGAVPAATIAETSAASSSGSELHSPQEQSSLRAEPGQKSAETEDHSHSTGELTPEEQLEVQELEARDAEVRQHELAHASVGGQHAGAAQLEYTRGPDGRLYASSGEVSIDTSSVAGDPQATIEKMQTVIQAALAPADPSAQDRQVAAKAQALLAEAVAALVNGEGKETEEVDEETEESQALDEEDDAKIGVDTSPIVESSVTQVENPLNTLASGVSTESDGLAIERRFVDAGAFSKVFPEGSVIESIV